MRGVETMTEDQLAAMVDVGTSEEIEDAALDAMHFEVIVDTPNQSKQKVAFAFHPGEEDSDTIILRTLPITERPGRSYEEGRNAALANATGAHVLTIGNLSTIGSSRLSEDQVRQLTRARVDRGESFMNRSTFTGVGDTLGRATKQALWMMNFDEPQLQRMTIVADFLSLGNNVGAGMIGQLDGDYTPSIVVWREMADEHKPVDIDRLQEKFKKHGPKRFHEYRDRNAQIAPNRHDRLSVAGARILWNPRANMRIYPAGIAGGSVITDVKDAYVGGHLSSDTVHVTVTGTESGVDTPLKAAAFRSLLGINMNVPTAGLEVVDATHPAYNVYDLNAAMVLRAMQLAEDA